MPAACASGKLLIVFFGSDGTENVGWPVGWTELGQSAVAPTVSIGYKQSAGTEAGGTITVTTPSIEHSSHISWCVDNAIAVATQPPEITTWYAAATGNPDPPSITPTGGAKDYLYVAVAGGDSGSITIDAYPASYGDNNTNVGGAAGDASGHIAVASRTLNAASADPGVFDFSIESSVVSATTIAIHPASAVATYTPQIIIVE